jgi:polar amino acid transport system substrate-binding protein
MRGRSKMMHRLMERTPQSFTFILEDIIYSVYKPSKGAVRSASLPCRELQMKRLCSYLGAFLPIAFAAAVALPVRHADAGTFEDIKAKGTAVVATEVAYPPFEFYQDGKIVGFDKDVLDAVIAGWGVKLDQLDVPFSGILAGLLQRKYDFVCTGLIMNPDRTSKYAFTMPVAAAPVVLVKRKDNAKFTSVDDLTGLRIGGPVPPSGPSNVLTSYSKDLGDKAAAAIVYFQSAPDEFLALANGQIDAAVETSLTVGDLIKKQPDSFVIVGSIGKPFYYGWAARPEDGGLRDAINAQIERLNKSGELGKLQEKWFGKKMDTPTSGYLPAGAL